RAETGDREAERRRRTAVRVAELLGRLERAARLVVRGERDDRAVALTHEQEVEVLGRLRPRVPLQERARLLAVLDRDGVRVVAAGEAVQIRLTRDRRVGPRPVLVAVVAGRVHPEDP